MKILTPNTLATAALTLIPAPLFIKYKQLDTRGSHPNPAVFLVRYHGRDVVLKILTITQKEWIEYMFRQEIACLRALAGTGRTVDLLGYSIDGTDLSIEEIENPKQSFFLRMSYADSLELFELVAQIVLKDNEYKNMLLFTDEKSASKRHPQHAFLRTLKLIAQYLFEGEPGQQVDIDTDVNDYLYPDLLFDTQNKEEAREYWKYAVTLNNPRQAWKEEKPVGSSIPEVGRLNLALIITQTILNDDFYSSNSDALLGTLITIYGYVFSQVKAAMVLEYEPEGTLHTALVNPFTLTVQERLVKALDIAEHVNYLSSLGYTLFDLRPSNILFSGRLIDFGSVSYKGNFHPATALAKNLSNLYRTSQTGEFNVTEETEKVQRFGQLLFEIFLLNRALPFSNNFISEIERALVCPAEIKMLIKDCMSPFSYYRPPSMKVVISVLIQALKTISAAENQWILVCQLVLRTMETSSNEWMTFAQNEFKYLSSSDVRWVIVYKEQIKAQIIYEAKQCISDSTNRWIWHLLVPHNFANFINALNDPDEPEDLRRMLIDIVCKRGNEKLFEKLFKFNTVVNDSNTFFPTCDQRVMVFISLLEFKPQKEGHITKEKISDKIKAVWQERAKVWLEPSIKHAKQYLTMSVNDWKAKGITREEIDFDDFFSLVKPFDCAEGKAALTKLLQQPELFEHYFKTLYLKGSELDRFKTCLNNIPFPEDVKYFMEMAERTWQYHLSPQGRKESLLRRVEKAKRFIGLPIDRLVLAIHQDMDPLSRPLNVCMLYEYAYTVAADACIEGYNLIKQVVSWDSFDGVFLGLKIYNDSNRWMFQDLEKKLPNETNPFFIAFIRYLLYRFGIMKTQGQANLKEFPPFPAALITNEKLSSAHIAGNFFLPEPVLVKASNVVPTAQCSAAAV